MTRSASEVIERYLFRLRAELDAAGAADTDDIVAEIRSVLVEAAGDDADAAVAQTYRLGPPEELARGILVESGLDSSGSMSSGVWWRLGVAAPVDLAIGLAVPLGAALPLAIVAAAGEPRAASIAVASILGIASLGWPFLIWRPWRRGGPSLSPGMTLAGIGVVRAPGFWRVMRIDEMEAVGPVPRRRWLRAASVTLVAGLLLAGSLLVGLDAAGTWVVASAASAGVITGAPAGSTLSAREARYTVARLYGLLDGSTDGADGGADSYVAPRTAMQLKELKARVGKLGVDSTRVTSMDQVAPGVYRLVVVEQGPNVDNVAPVVGSSTITVGVRYWMSADGPGGDWVVVGIEPGAGPVRR